MTNKPKEVWTKGEPVEKLMGMLRETLAEMDGEILSYDDIGLPIPPWIAFPEIGRGSIGWRMGGGEDYWGEFWTWYRSQKEPEKLKYQSLYPEPEEGAHGTSWIGIYEQIGSLDG